MSAADAILVVTGISVMLWGITEIVRRYHEDQRK